MAMGAVSRCKEGQGTRESTTAAFGPSWIRPERVQRMIDITPATVPQIAAIAPATIKAA